MGSSGPVFELPFTLKFGPVAPPCHTTWAAEQGPMSATGTSVAVAAAAAAAAAAAKGLGFKRAV